MALDALGPIALWVVNAAGAGSLGNAATELCRIAFSRATNRFDPRGVLRFEYNEDLARASEIAILHAESTLLDYVHHRLLENDEGAGPARRVVQRIRSEVDRARLEISDTGRPYYSQLSSDARRLSDDEAEEILSGLVGGAIEERRHSLNRIVFADLEARFRDKQFDLPELAKRAAMFGWSDQASGQTWYLADTVGYAFVARLKSDPRTLASFLHTSLVDLDADISEVLHHAKRILSAVELSHDLIARVATDLSSIARQLTGLSEKARSLPYRVGRALEFTGIGDADLARRKNSVGALVQWVRLTDGVYAPRPHLLEELRHAFLEWTTTIEETHRDRRLPVFWLDGRSGDGKSVLLLQLAASILAACDGAAILQAYDADNLPEVIEHAHQTDSGTGLVLVLVDDLHRVSDEETFKDAMRGLLDLSSLRIAVLACGPTPEKEAFLRANRYIEARSWTVPSIELADVHALEDWFESSIEIADLSHRNVLVEILFVAQVGKPIEQFASSFRERLERFDVFETVRRIVSVNAVDVSAPLIIFNHISERQSIERLARNDQLHFEWIEERWGQGVRLVHNRIAWRLFEEWARDDSLRDIPTVDRFAETLASVLNMPGLSDFQSFEILRAVRSRYATLFEVESTHVADELARFYENLVEAAGDQSAARCYAVRGALSAWWMNRSSGCGEATLSTARHVADDEQAPPFSRAMTAALLAALGKAGKIDDTGQRDRAEILVLSPTVGPFSGYAVPFLVQHGGTRSEIMVEWIRRFTWADAPVQLILMLMASEIPRETVLPLTLGWLDAHGAKAGTEILLSALIRVAGAEEKVRERALDWLDANAHRLNAHPVFCSLLGIAGGDDMIRQRALHWIEVNPDKPGAAMVLCSLLGTAGVDDTVRKRALDWVDANAARPGVEMVLCSLLGVAGGDAAVRQRALDWVEINADRPGADQVLTSLLGVARSDDAVRQRALVWIDANADKRSAAQVLSSLLAVAGDDETVRKRALDWAEANSDKPGASDVLASLLRIAGSDEPIRQHALDWIDENADRRSAAEVLSSALAVAGDEEAVRQRALNWAEANADNLGASDVLASLLRIAGSEEPVRQRALDWMDVNADRPGAHQVLASLLGVAGGDETVRQRALDWLDGNAEKRGAEQVLAALVGVAAGDKKVMEWALDWLGDHDGNPRTGTVLTALLRLSDLGEAASTGLIDRLLSLVRTAPSLQRNSYFVGTLAQRLAENPDVIKIVSAYLSESRNAARDVVLGRWIRGGGPEGTAMDFIFSQLRQHDSATPQGRQMFAILCRAAARNMDVLFAASTNKPEIANEICFVVGRGIPHVETAPAALVETIGSWPAGNEGFLWRGLLESDADFGSFIDTFIDWLESNYRRRGYGEVLAGIAKREGRDPALWSRIPAGVLADLRLRSA